VRKIMEKELPAILFFQALYQHCSPKSYINLRSFLQGSPKNHSFLSLQSLSSLPSALRSYGGCDCFFAVATREKDKGTKEGILEIPALWVDIDFPKLRQPDIEKRLESFPLQPNLKVRSGNGYHLYWILKEPAKKEDIPQVEDLLKSLALALGGDMGATDASRILRIPGTRNHKYDPPREVRLEILQREWEYGLSDFDFLPAFEEKLEGKGSTPGWYSPLLEAVPEGERNTALVKLAGRYLSKGLSREEILPLLQRINSAYQPPLSEREVAGILDSVTKTHRRRHPNEEQQGKAGVSLKVSTLEDVFAYPDPTYLIDPILVEGTVSVLGAYTGTGKSLLSLSIIKSILTQDLLWGRFPVLKSGPVLLIDEETPKGFLKERIEKMGFSPEMPLFFLHFQDVRLDEEAYFEALLEKVEEVHPLLIVIDSLIRVHRQKEDDAASMSRVIGRLRKIANAGTTVLVIHHHRKGEGPIQQKLRGSSDIPGGVDIEYALVKKEDYLLFYSVKTRTQPLEPIKLRIEVTEEEIEWEYAGTEEEDALEIIVDILGDGRPWGVNEIWEELKRRECEIGINRLRKALAEASGKEIVGEKVKEGRTRKWVYRLP
jgi:hypothetical protein